MQHLTRTERERLTSVWQEMYPKAEIIAHRGHHEGQYCFDFQSLQVEVHGHTRNIMARTPEGARIDFTLERGKYNDHELLRLEKRLGRRSLVPVTIGYVAGGRVGNLRQMHYVAVPALGDEQRSAQYVFI